MAVRRSFTPEFKQDAIRMVTDQGLSYSEVARKLGIDQSLLRRWKQPLDAQGEQAFPGHGQQLGIEAELARLRAENKRLQAERDILTNAQRSSRKSRASVAVLCLLRLADSRCK